MKRELEIWQFAAERLKRNESVMLLVVAESSGSSPGRQGFKMIVAENDLCGSIGGGVMEVRLVEQAKFKIQNSKFKKNASIVEQIHQKNSPSASGMICSGKQTVIFRRLDFNDLPVVGEIINALENHQSKTLRITNDKLQIKETEKSDSDFAFENQNENEFVYSEKLGCKNKLYIVGGGHCALALSELMAKMDFYVSLFDDRQDLNTLDKNKFADRKIVVESYEKIDDYIESGANVYVVVMTIGYQSDAVVIRKLLDKDFKYFGVLGSKAKMATLLRQLKNEGFATEKLNRIRTPIGIEINSRTPEEIAVSIAAEIIKVKNAR
jgi:xanthine dehydrogenase accessory factor